MTNRASPACCLLLMLLSTGGNPPCLAADSPAKPNILVILADDLDYADLGCQGSPDVKTPHIDSLASNGIRRRGQAA